MPPVEDEDDLLAFLQTDEFAKTIAHAGGSFVAIFDHAYVSVLMGQGGPVESRSPALSAARTIDVQDLQVGTVLSLEDEVGEYRDYKVRSHQPDGTGMSVVLLTRMP